MHSVTCKQAMPASNTSFSHLPTKFHNYPTYRYCHNLILVQRPQNTRSSSVVGRRYFCSATDIILSKNNRLLLSLCFTL